MLLIISISTCSRSRYSWCRSWGTIFKRFSRPFLHKWLNITISLSREYSSSGKGRTIPSSLAVSRANLKLGGVGSPSLISRLHLSATSWVFSMASGISAKSSAICAGDFT